MVSQMACVCVSGGKCWKEGAVDLLNLAEMGIKGLGGNYWGKVSSVNVLQETPLCDEAWGSHRISSYNKYRQKRMGTSAWRSALRSMANATIGG